MNTRSRRRAEAVKFDNRQMRLIESARPCPPRRVYRRREGGALARKVSPNGGYKRMRGRLRDYKIVRLWWHCPARTRGRQCNSPDISCYRRFV